MGEIDILESQTGIYALLRLSTAQADTDLKQLTYEKKKDCANGFLFELS